SNSRALMIIKQIFSVVIDKLGGFLGMVHLSRRGFRRSGRAAIHSLVWNAPKKDGHVFVFFSYWVSLCRAMVRLGGSVRKKNRRRLFVWARDGSVACRGTRRAN